jgi:alkylated DNA nucleotide flippase Atl1
MSCVNCYEIISDKTRTDQKYRERVYKIVRRIPRGRVMTYGQSPICRRRLMPRTVGFAMHGADEKNPAWHRVINSQGKAQLAASSCRRIDSNECSNGKA